MKSTLTSTDAIPRRAMDSQRFSTAKRSDPGISSFLLHLTSFVLAAAFLLVTSPAFGQLPPKAPKQAAKESAQPEPVARWTFDEEVGGGFPSVGRGEPLKTFGSVEVASGRSGNALKFGANGWGLGEIEQSMGDLVGGEYTVMFWMLQENPPINTSGYATLFTTASLQGLTITTQQHSLVDVMQSKIFHYVATNRKIPQIGQGWTQIAYTFDGGRGVLYVAGERFERPDAESTPVNPPIFGPMMALGTSPRAKEGGADVPEEKMLPTAFHGGLDDLRIYDVALTEEQILAAENE